MEENQNYIKNNIMSEQSKPKVEKTVTKLAPVKTTPAKPHVEIR